MKKLLLLLGCALFFFQQEGNAQEKFGKALNLGIGIGGYGGYYGYVNGSIPILNANYEFDVAKNFTLAPSISFSTYSNSYYWGNKNHPYQYYGYTETVIPIGVKGTYYFDEIFKANSKWDFYLGGTLGFAIVNSHWDSGFEGDKYYYHNNGNPLFLNIHIGAEYHFTNMIGAFIDLSNGFSSIGIAIHGSK